MRSALLFMLAAALATSNASARNLSSRFDCLREGNSGVVSAHRGSRDPGAPENSLGAFASSVRAGIVLLETDVRRTRDGVLMLLHDDTLDRTTTGQGRLDALTAAEVARSRVRDAEGRMTRDRVPTLATALAWAGRNRAILQLDVKRGTPFTEVVAAVRAARAEARVVIIVYNEADAVEVARLAPELMMSVSADRAGEIATLMARGVRADRMLGFTGTREPDRTLLNELRRVGVEPIVGTLGPAATRLDERYLADGNGSEYAELIRGGAAIIATDRPVEALAALKRAGRDGTRCLSVNPPR